MAELLHTEPSESPSEHAHTTNVELISDVTHRVLPTGEDDPFDEALKLMPTRQLRVLVNRAFKALDSPNPPHGTQADYDMLVDELEDRERREVLYRVESIVRETFRDNALYRRFELRIDGVLAAHMRYRIKAGRIALIEGVEQPGFRDQGVESVLLRHVLLNTHRRRLSVVPQCPMVFAFLADNPQYQVLTASGTAPSTHLHV